MVTTTEVTTTLVQDKCRYSNSYNPFHHEFLSGLIHPFLGREVSPTSCSFTNRRLGKFNKMIFHAFIEQGNRSSFGHHCALWQWWDLEHFVQYLYDQHSSYLAVLLVLPELPRLRATVERIVKRLPGSSAALNKNEQILKDPRINTSFSFQVNITWNPLRKAEHSVPFNFSTTWRPFRLIWIAFEEWKMEKWCKLSVQQKLKSIIDQ